MPNSEDKSWTDQMMGDDDSLDEKPEEQTPPVEETPVEPVTEQPAKVEEPVEPAPPETEPEPAKTDEEQPTRPDYTALAEQYGIIKQFGSLENALRQVPEMNRYLTRLEQERARDREERARERGELEALKRLQQQYQRTPVAPLDPDAFMQDPQAAIRQMGIPTVDEVRSMVDERAQSLLAEQQRLESSRRAKDFVTSHADFDSLFPTIQNIYNDIPGIENLPYDKAVKVLYFAAKGQQPAAPKPPVVVPSPGAAKKDQAKTAGGGPSGKQAAQVKPLTREQADAMTEEQLEAIYRPPG